MGDDADRLGASLVHHQLHELLQERLRLARAFTVIRVSSAKPAARRPAIGEGRSVELQVIGNLRCAVDGVVEARIVAVHEDEGVVLVGRRLRQTLAHEGEELVLRQRLQLLHGEVGLRILRLLVDRDVDIWNFFTTHGRSMAGTPVRVFGTVTSARPSSSLRARPEP